jgi:hypothetical protein
LPPHKNKNSSFDTDGEWINLAPWCTPGKLLHPAIQYQSLLRFLPFSDGQKTEDKSSAVCKWWKTFHSYCKISSYFQITGCTICAIWNTETIRHSRASKKETNFNLFLEQTRGPFRRQTWNNILSGSSWRFSQFLIISLEDKGIFSYGFWLRAL